MGITVGRKLKAIDACTMPTGHDALTVNWLYEVVEIKPRPDGLLNEFCIVIINDKGQRHSFTTDAILTYFKL